MALVVKVRRQIYHMIQVFLSRYPILIYYITYSGIRGSYDFAVYSEELLGLAERLEGPLPGC
jgi:hypothetical protein